MTNNSRTNDIVRMLPFLPDKSGLGCQAHPLYSWQLEFINTLARYGFICAANQIGKSAAQWIRMLRFVYLKSYWDRFFGGNKPLQFWYFYPSVKLATSEIKTKYIRTYLPHEDLKKHPKWGYQLEESKKQIQAIHFNNGVSTYFQSYQQPPTVLQAATLSGVFADEEMPRSLFDELNFRGVSQDNFYYSNVFTATLGQEYLRRTIEEKGLDTELFVGGFKKQISMYDCLKYADGSPSLIWTPPKIEEAKKNCTSQAEVQRRVYGRFVLSDDLKFPAFDIQRNTAKGHPVPLGWHKYAGLDWGSGSPRGGHPSAIVFLAVDAEYKRGRVFLSWRGDGIRTTQGDVVQKYVTMSNDMTITEAAYDYSAADIGTIASRAGVSISRANKNQVETVELLNTLFKNGQLKIYVGDGYEQNDKLVTEITSALSKPHTKLNDDLIDALRYAAALVPWHFEMQIEKEEEQVATDEEMLSPREYFWKHGYKGAELWDDANSSEHISDYMELNDYYGI